MGCKQNSKSNQVPEFNETYLVESKKQLNNDDSYVGILSNMMEKETHVDSAYSVFVNVKVVQFWSINCSLDQFSG